VDYVAFLMQNLLSEPLGPGMRATRDQHRSTGSQEQLILKGGREMAEKEHFGTALSRAIQAARRSTVTTDRSSLSDTLVKSPQWKKNALQKIESAQSGENNDTTPREACVQQAFKRIRGTLARHLKELKDAKRQLRRKTATLQRRNEEFKQLRQTIAKLKAEIADLTTEHRAERDAQRVELLRFQKAYDQFEQQTDMVLYELDQQNERLRIESRRRYRRSMH
jgi:chromosome segregation ATPase